MKRLTFVLAAVWTLGVTFYAQTLPPANLSNTTPAAPSGYQNCQWQADSSVPRNISCYVPASGAAYNYGYGICNGLTPGYSTVSTAVTPGMVTFGSSNYWHTNISSASVDPNSANIINFIVARGGEEGIGFYEVGKLTIGTVGVASGVMTITGAQSGAYPPSVGRTVTFSGLTTLTALNGLSATVTSVIGGVAAPTGVTTTVPSGVPSSYATAADTGLVTTTDTPPRLFPLFGSATGIPFSIIDSSVTPLVNVTNSVAYNSDNTAAPVPTYLPLEGLPAQCTVVGDQHGLMLDKNTCWDYEWYQMESCNGTWTANQETVWDLTNYNERPPEWTSVDAAGMPVLPGLLRHDEVAFGSINHAIRATFAPTHSAYIFPATHWAGDDGPLGEAYRCATCNYNSPIAMGMRLRLKASFNMNGFSAQNQVILRALQTYGMIAADNGDNLFLTGTQDGQWNDNDLNFLHLLTVDDFDVVQMPPVYTVLDVGYQVTITGCSHATFLNGNTYVNSLHEGWSGFTAPITYSGSYSTTGDTCTANITLPAGSYFTLPGTWTASLPTISVSSDVLTGTFALDWNGQPNEGSNIPNSPASPVISTFTATPSTTSGPRGASTLAWTTSGGSYMYLSQCDTGCPSTGSANPQVGVVRSVSGAGSVTVSPQVTTTYTLNVLNNSSQYAITQKSVTVTVP